LLRFWRRCGGGWCRCDCFRRFGSFSPLLPFSLFFSVCFFSFVFGLVLPLFPFLFSVFFVPLFSFSLLRSISSSLSPLFFFVFSPRLSSVFLVFSLCPLLLCWLLFIEPSEWLFAVEHGEQPAGRPLGATANARPPLPDFLAGERWVVGHCVRSVGSRRESGRQKFKKKLPFFLLPRNVIGGRR